MAGIPVVYSDGMFGFVDSQELNSLLVSEEVVKFLRGDTWVYPGVDPVRRSDSDSMPWGRRRTDPQYQVS